MPIAGVICEFNPFHNGHKYLLDEIRKKGFDTIICIMSGSFTQRGEAAIIDKFSRAKTALSNGADIIIELPVVWATASAQRFAQGAAEIINALGVVDKVFFGSEAGDISLIKKAADATQEKDTEEAVARLMKDGAYYPSALQSALKELYSDELSQIIAQPNNTLGVEYIKELKKFGIDVDTIKRKGVQHDSKEVNGRFASASYLRQCITENKDISSFTPSYTPNDFSNPAHLKNAERIILYKLMSMSAQELKDIPDVSEGLENRIVAAAKVCQGIDELLINLKTKRYTMARLRRIVTCALLDISKEMQSSPVPYIRILGATKNGTKALTLIKEQAALPVITSVSKGLKALSPKEAEILLCDIRATDVRGLFLEKISPACSDYKTAFIKV